MANHRFRSFIAINCGGDYCGVVHHWTIENPAITDAWLLAQQIADELEGAGASAGLFSNLSPMLSDDSFIQSIRVKQLLPTSGPTYVKVFPPADYPGTAGSNVEANQVAGCSIWVTAAQLGLSGRTFWPGVSQTSITNGRFTNSYKTDHDNVRDFLTTPIVGTSETIIFTLRSAAGPTWNYIVDGYLSPTPGTQRRRLTPY